MLEKVHSMEKQVNTFILTIMTIIDLLIFGGYIADYAKGNIGIVFAVTVDGIVLISLLCSYVVYFRKKDSELFKHVSIVGYMLVYAIAVFGAQNDLVFTMAFPLCVLYILYYDYKLIFRASLGFGLINIADIIYAVAVLGHAHSGAPIDSTSLLLQGATIIVFVVVLCGTTRISNANNSSKLESINQEKERSSELLSEVLKVAVAVKNNSNEAAIQINQLSEHVQATASELKDISNGNSNNAVSIENQTVMTNNIQNMIIETKKLSDEMIELANQSGEASQNGQAAIDRLQQQQQRTGEANEQLVDSVTNLISNAKEVGEITEKIFSISSQTNLLALNASIESARAGEAGRGFSVVADEIRTLADETRTLTEGIQRIVTELKQNADTAKATVDNVLEVAGMEQNLIMDANGQFKEIGSKISGLNDNVRKNCDMIEKILESNNKIVDSINNISAVSEQVTACTDQAVQLGNDSSQKAETVKALMDELMSTVQTIDKYNQ